MTFADLIAQFGTTAKDKLDGPGEREALLSGPVARLIEDLGAESGMKTVAHDEVREQDGSVRPDFGVRVNDVLVGHIELKAPGVSLDPESYGKTTHNYRQWQRLKELPNCQAPGFVEGGYLASTRSSTGSGAGSAAVCWASYSAGGT